MKLPDTMENFLLYAKHTTNLSDKTIRNYHINLNDFYSTMCHNQEIYTNLVLEDFQEWIEYLKTDRKLSASSINQRIATLSSFFSYLQMIGKIEKNIPSKMKKIKSKEIVERTILTESEMEQMFHLVKEERVKENNYISYRNELIVHLFLTTGLRIEELAKISLSDINQKTGAISVIGKRNRRRTVILPDTRLEMLVNYLNKRTLEKGAKDEALFLSRQKSKNGYRLGMNQIRQTVIKIAQDANVSKITPHSLRHSNATFLIQKGVDLMDISKNLGHSSIAITEKIYIHQTLESSRRVAVAFDNIK